MGLTKKKIKLLSEFMDNICEQCHKKAELEPHRLIRGWDGGNYCHRNLKMVCADCHKLFHGNEFSRCKSKLNNRCENETRIYM